MRIRIFRAVGENNISELETQINSWAASKLDKEGRQVIHSSTALSETAGSGISETQPCLVVTLWVDGYKNV